MKKIGTYLVSAAIAASLLLTACGKSTSMYSGTHFAKYAYSESNQEIVLDLLFYTTESDLEKWNINSIESAILQIGYDSFFAEIDSISVSEDTSYDNFYMGQMEISSVVEENISGDMQLKLQFTDEENEVDYELGEMAVLASNSSDDKCVNEASCSGLTATDENGSVHNYGIFLHIGVSEDVILNQISFGLEDIGTDLSEAIIFSPDDYHNNILPLIDNTTLDREIPNCYEINYTDSLSDTGTLTVEKGEHYIYVPISHTKGSSLDLIEAAVQLALTDASGEKSNYVIQTNPFYSEFSKSEADVIEMFH